MRLSSEQTARELDKYTRKLVRGMPNWIKRYFKEGLVIFELEDDGNLCLGFAVLDDGLEIPENKKALIADKVCEYMESHPCPVIKVLEVQ